MHTHKPSRLHFFSGFFFALKSWPQCKCDPREIKGFTKVEAVPSLSLSPFTVSSSVGVVDGSGDTFMGRKRRRRKRNTNVHRWTLFGHRAANKIFINVYGIYPSNTWAVPQFGEESTPALSTQQNDAQTKLNAKRRRRRKMRVTERDRETSNPFKCLILQSRRWWFCFVDFNVLSPHSQFDVEWACLERTYGEQNRIVYMWCI